MDLDSIRRFAWRPVAATVLGVAAFAACSSRDGFDDAPTRFTTEEAGVLEAGPPCGFQCSPDLKRVIRSCPGQETSTEQCSVDQGCGVDHCVDACESASLSKGSTGCSFWTLPPDDGKNGPGSCFAAILANTWDRPVNLRAEWGADALDISSSVYTFSGNTTTLTYKPLGGALPVGEVAVVFLSRTATDLDYQTAACPPGTQPAVRRDPILHGTTKTKAFHIIADAPIAAYSIYPYGGATTFFPSATLLLPQSSWDTSYLTVTPSVVGMSPGDPTMLLRTLQIVGGEDGTEVTMRPHVDITPGTGVPAVAAYQTATFPLAKGEVLQITQAGLTSGSALVSSKPVGVFGGAPAVFMPADQCCADTLQQQVEPFAQWGNAYALVPFLSRIASVTGPARETVLYSFVGAVDGTTLAYDPARPPGAPDTLAAGQVASFLTDTLAHVKSQDASHPFHATLYMTGSYFGGGVPGGGVTLGDPDFVGIVPSDQFLDHYVFFADYTFPETSFTIVRRRSATGFKDVTLTCAGVLTGWQPLGAGGEYEYVWVRVTSGGLPQKFAQGTCGYGRHEASSEGTFSVTVWGTSDDASYGYAAGRGSRPINQAPPPTVR